MSIDYNEQRRGEDLEAEALRQAAHTKRKRAKEVAGGLHGDGTAKTCYCCGSVGE